MEECDFLESFLLARPYAIIDTVKYICEMGFSAEIQALSDIRKTHIFYYALERERLDEVVNLIDNLEASVQAYQELETITEEALINKIESNRSESKSLLWLLSKINPSMLKNEGVALAILKSSNLYPEARIKLIHPDLFDNKEFVSVAALELNTSQSDTGCAWFRYVSDRLKKDKNFILSLLKIEKFGVYTKYIITYCPALYDDEEVAIEVLTTTMPEIHNMSFLVSFFTPRVKLLLRDIIRKVI